MLKIQVPDSANSDISVSLGGKTYTFRYNFSTISQTYYLTILYNNTVIISSLKLIDNVLLLRKYALDDFEHGDLFVAKMKETSSPVGRYNLGIDKAYELIYISNEEISEV